MKANLQKLIGTAVLGLAMFSQSLSAWAGQQIRPEVAIGPNYAYGSTVGARYSADTQQYIYCYIVGDYFGPGNNPLVLCGARDKTGTYYTCQKADASWATVVKSITDSSLITFGGDAAGSCDRLIVENHSSHLR